MDRFSVYVSASAVSQRPWKASLQSEQGDFTVLMIAGHFKVPAERRKAFVDAHADLVRRARAYSGCLDLSISEDPFDPSRVNLMELWESEAVLEAWRKISNPPKTDVQIEGGNVKKHHISHSAPPF